MYFHSLEKFHRNSTWKNSIYQETVLMIIFHVFLRIIALLQTPRPDPEGSMTGIMKAWTLEHWVGLALGMNTAYALADCSWDYPRREWPGVKTRRCGLCQCSVLGKTDQRKFCSLQLGIKAGLRVDSAPQSNRGCRSPDPLQQVSCFVFILIVPSFVWDLNNFWLITGTDSYLGLLSLIRLYSFHPPSC